MNLEKEIQREVFKWAVINYDKYPQLRLMFSTQNGLNSNALSVKLAKLTGLKNGVPDICLPIPNGKYHSLWIELKRKGGKAREEQKYFIEQLNFYGNYAVVIDNYNDAVQTIINYLEE